jgi:glutamate mutase epsilon subunit
MRPEWGLEMMDDAEKRGQLIRHLEDALALADEIQDGHTGYLIERALDEARSRQFRRIA